MYAPSRELALQSKENERVVLFIYSLIEDFVMTTLAEFEGRKLKNIDSNDIDTGNVKGIDENKDLLLQIILDVEQVNEITYRSLWVLCHCKFLCILLNTK